MARIIVKPVWPKPKINKYAEPRTNYLELDYNVKQLLSEQKPSQLISEIRKTVYSIPSDNSFKIYSPIGNVVLFKKPGVLSNQLLFTSGQKKQQISLDNLESLDEEFKIFLPFVNFALKALFDKEKQAEIGSNVKKLVASKRKPALRQID